MLNNIIFSLKNLNYKLYLALLLMAFLPTLYNTIRIFLLSGLPSDYGFNIASQLIWLNLIYEVSSEALILPLFFFTGAVLVNKIELENRTKTGLIVAFTINIILAVILIIFTEPLVLLMAQNAELIEATISFIRLESIAKIFEILLRIALVTLITMASKLSLYLLLIAQLVLTILFDLFFLSTLPLSLNLGVNGIAITNIIVNLSLFILALMLLRKVGINIFSKNKLNFTWLKGFTKVGIMSGIESLIRNLAFMVMIIRMINVIAEQDTYWLANSFIWGWLLLPVLQLGELIKRNIGEDKALDKSKIKAYFALTTIIIIAWLISIPLWQPFLASVMGVQNPSEIFTLIILLLGFYILFAYNNIIDSIFYGLGRTDLMLYQSLIVNICYYGAAFMLYLLDIYTPTLTSIALMFGIGIALDSIITLIIFGNYCRKNKVKILL